MALNDSAELLDVIRLRGSIPLKSPDWTAAKILRHATLELLQTHLPMLLAARGEYLVKSEDLALVSGQLAYRLNPRCAAVRYIGYLQSDGRLREIPEAKPGELFEGQASSTLISTPCRYIFREHSIELWPLPGNTNDKIRVKWHQRPSRICDVIECATVTNVQANTPIAGQTTVTFAQPTGSIWSAATRFDLVKSSSPFDILSSNLLPLSASATTKVFTSSELSADFQIGDAVCPANYSSFANVPVELHEAIALRTAAAVIKAKDRALSDDLVTEATAKERQLLIGVLAPRSKGNAKVIPSRRW